MNNAAEELCVARACWLNNFNNNSNFNANNRNLNNTNSALRGIAHTLAEAFIMQRDLWNELCSYDNLFLAYKKARKHKTTKEYVTDFENNLKANLLALRSELLLHSYRPKPLVTFIIRDPKSRRISKSDFRDRVVHHALCNILEPIFDRTFIYDSYANRKGKGTLKAVKRFEYFKKKVSRNNTKKCFIQKADIQKYFDNIDHNQLLKIIKKKIHDKRVLWLIKIIISNSACHLSNKGMPLGNLTSQFFANVYLNELDYYTKFKLKVKYYIRYVDDFVIIHTDKLVLNEYKDSINCFLKQNLSLQLHSEKSKVIKLGRSLSFLGFRLFYHHNLLKKANLRKRTLKYNVLKQEYLAGKTDYDKIYDYFEGWLAYAKYANTYHLRKKIICEFEKAFPNEISTKEINKYLKKK